jgi:hypothetical protein
MAIQEADIQGRLRALIDPNTGKDFVAGKAVRKVPSRRGVSSICSSVTRRRPSQPLRA